MFDSLDVIHGIALPSKELETLMLRYIGRTISDMVGRIRVRSALNPILWLCAIVAVPGMFLAAQQEGGAPTWLVILIFLPVSVAVIGFLFFLFFDRDKLQSEEYQLRKQSLELIQEKGDSFPVDAPSIESITNPERPRLDAEDTGGA